MVRLRRSKVGKTVSPLIRRLSAEGLAQADKVTAWLQRERIDRIYSSPMKRAFETARADRGPARPRDRSARGRRRDTTSTPTHYIPVEEMKELDYEPWLAPDEGRAG
ncbi:MAG: histidine phosphatase family protein [Gammaproteobacteria bacterium]|nr:histidine phosphatase family protein [Gammaproteobacteria bacterium]